MSHFASIVKTDWTGDPDMLVSHAERVAQEANDKLSKFGTPEQQSLALDPKFYQYGLKSLDPELRSLLLTGSISPLPLHRTLTLLEVLHARNDPSVDRYERLALAKALVTRISNLEFGPEVGVGPAKKDVYAVTEWLATVRSIADDLRVLGDRANIRATVHHADSRVAISTLPPASIDAVITSPPYPNEKDYTRTTRLESVLLGFVKSKAELQSLKRTLVRSNTRGVYKQDDDDQWVAGHEEIQRIASAIEARRIELGKNSGFEKLYARVTKLYFGGMVRHLADLRAALRPGARLAYVVGDQASYLQVMIRTGQLLADLATGLGYEVESIDLFRTRLSTATRQQLREEVVVLRWPG